MNDATVLLATRDPSLQQAVAETVRSLPHLQFRTVAGLTEVPGCLRRGNVALLLPHLTVPGDTDAMVALLRKLALWRTPVATLAIGENRDPVQVLTLLRAGAADFLPRPLDLGRLAYLLDVLTLRLRHLPPAPAASQDVPPDVPDEWRVDESFICDPEGTLGQLIEQVRRVAPQDMTILLGGETGTGKTRLARLIHDLSPRRAAPFVTVNCGSLSRTLMESELFGHVRGAFTGADRDRPGKFAQVGRGTILLDDIDALPLDLQAKLLRVVEDREFEPVGSNRTLAMEARLIAASNRDLQEEVNAGRFRADLYYRLHVMAFQLPPLREQLAILAALVARFISDFAEHHGRPVRGIAGDALLALQGHSWPGNVRELRNVIERAVVLCLGDCIEVSNLPDTFRFGLTKPKAIRVDRPAALAPVLVAGTLLKTKEAVEALRITEALARNKNNRLKAAAELGISRMTLYNKMHRYGLIDVME
jgi:two-component system response regulator HydG